MRARLGARAAVALSASCAGNWQEMAPCRHADAPASPKEISLQRHAPLSSRGLSPGPNGVRQGRCLLTLADRPAARAGTHATSAFTRGQIGGASCRASGWSYVEITGGAD